MQYALITMINGNWKIEVETNNRQQVLVNFHQKCATLWNAADVSRACVWVVNQSLGIIESEEILHSEEPSEG